MILFAPDGTMMYSLYNCNEDPEYLPFPTDANLPETQKKEWIVEKRGLDIKVYCNGILVLDLTVSSDICDDSNWEKFSRAVNSIKFINGYDTATKSIYIGW